MTSRRHGDVVLVTGAGGFIGSAIVAGLVKEAVPVRAGLRRRARPKLPVQTDLATCVCDLDDANQVRAATAGASAVVHTAYGSDSAMVQQCRTLLAAMATENVQTLVYLSSIAVYGGRVGVIDETMPPDGKLTAYGKAKYACEALVRRWVGDNGAGARRAIILRPGIVYGTKSKFWIDKMAERIACGAWGTFGSAGDGIAALVHVDDLVKLVLVTLKWLELGNGTHWPNPAVINVVGPERKTWNEYFEALAAAVHASQLPRLDPVSIASRQAWAIPAKIWRRIGLPGGRRAALAPTPGEIALFSRRAIYSMDAAARLTGFLPKIGLAEGLEKTVLCSG